MKNFEPLTFVSLKLSFNLYVFSTISYQIFLQPLFFVEGNREAMKGLGIAVTLIIFSQCTASLPFVNYAVTIFEKSGTSLNPYISSIMLATSLLLGSILTTYLADKLGRKLLNFISLAGAAVGLFAMSAYQYFNINGYNLSDYAWTPVVCLSFVIFISSAGITPLSVVCSVECIPLKVHISIIHFTINFTEFYRLYFRFEHLE